MNTLALTYAFARSNFLIFLAHRLRYLIGIVNYLVYAAVNWYLWAAVFGPNHLVAGWSLADMQTYVCVNWILRSAYFSNSDNVLAARINKGEISADLIRPSPLLVQFYGMALGEMLFRVVFMAVPVGVLIVYLFGLVNPASHLSGFGFMLSAVLAFHIFFAINFLTGLCAVLTEKLQGFLWAKFLLIQFLSGHLLPLEFFPGPMKVILEWLPFKGLAYTPMSIYLGRWGSDRIWSELALQFFWTVALLVLCEVAWRLVRRRLSILGG